MCIRTIGMTSATSPPSSTMTNNLPYFNAEALIQSTRPDWSLLYYLYTPIRLCINAVKPHIRPFPRYQNPLTTIRQVSTTATSADASLGGATSAGASPVSATSAVGDSTSAAGVGSLSSTAASDVVEGLTVEEEEVVNRSIELVGRNQHRFKL